MCALAVVVEQTIFGLGGGCSGSRHLSVSTMVHVFFFFNKSKLTQQKRTQRDDETIIDELNGNSSLINKNTYRVQ